MPKGAGRKIKEHRADRREDTNVSGRVKNSGAGGEGGGGGFGRTLLAPDTSIGQHFLKNPAVVDSIVTKGNLRPSDTVLEVGPGTGNLTMRLLDSCKKLVAVEFDRRMVREVLKRAEGHKNERALQVIQGDVLKVDLPYFDVCVANLPYQISSPFLFKMLTHRPMFRSAVIMFQAEFANRLSAKPGSELYCRLSVNCQLLSKVENVLKVGRGNFRPPPKVDSIVVRIEIKNPPPPINFVEWDGLVRTLFNRKHKTLRAILTAKSYLAILEENYRTHLSLSNTGTVAAGAGEKTSAADGSSGPGMDTDLGFDMKSIVEEVLTTEGYSDKRAATLDISDFMCLLAAFNTRGIHFS